MTSKQSKSKSQKENSIKSNRMMSYFGLFNFIGSVVKLRHVKHLTICGVLHSVKPSKPLMFFIDHCIITDEKTGSINYNERARVRSENIIYIQLVQLPQKQDSACVKTQDINKTPEIESIPQREQSSTNKYLSPPTEIENRKSPVLDPEVKSNDQLLSTGPPIQAEKQDISEVLAKPPLSSNSKLISTKDEQNDVQSKCVLKDTKAQSKFSQPDVKDKNLLASRDMNETKPQTDIKDKPNKTKLNQEKYNEKYSNCIRNSERLNSGQDEKAKIGENGKSWKKEKQASNKPNHGEGTESITSDTNKSYKYQQQYPEKTQKNQNHRNHSNLSEDNKKVNTNENSKQKGRDNRINKQKSSNQNNKNNFKHKSSYDGYADNNAYEPKEFGKNSSKPPLSNNFATPTKDKLVHEYRRKEFKNIPNGKRQNDENSSTFNSSNKQNYSKAKFKSFNEKKYKENFLNDFDDQNNEFDREVHTEEKLKTLDEGLNINSAPYIPKESFEQKSKWFSINEIYSFENFMNPEHSKLIDYAEKQIKNGNKKGKYDFPKPNALIYSEQK